jgi:hypothetical protein
MDDAVKKEKKKKKKTNPYPCLCAIPLAVIPIFRPLFRSVAMVYMFLTVPAMEHQLGYSCCVSRIQVFC